jgi:hypothetical protein
LAKGRIYNCVTASLDLSQSEAKQRANLESYFGDWMEATEEKINRMFKKSMYK